MDLGDRKELSPSANLTNISPWSMGSLLFPGVWQAYPATLKLAYDEYPPVPQLADFQPAVAAAAAAPRAGSRTAIQPCGETPEAVGNVRRRIFHPSHRNSQEEFGPNVGWTPPPQWLGPDSPTTVVGPRRPNWANLAQMLDYLKGASF